MSIASKVWARSDYIMATSTKVFRVSCLKDKEAGGCQLARKFKTLFTSQITWYLRNDERCFPKILNNHFILGSSPISKNC